MKFEGKNGISVTVIGDSLSVLGTRMTTFELVYPRFIHSELMTHRALSKNASSSRAVPLKSAIENLINNPSSPVYWGKNQAGMQAKEELSGEDLDRAKMLWNKAIRVNIDIVKEFSDLNVHKQIAARWLETGQLMKTVVSGTDWENFLYLRNDEEAQPEFRELASTIKRAFDESTPYTLLSGEWHLPYVRSTRIDGYLIYLTSDGKYIDEETALKISASCCAQVSYRNLNDTEEKALEIYNKLFSGRKPHMSPTEHQAMSYSEPYDNTHRLVDGITHITRNGNFYSGNLNGFIQYRQTLPNNVYTGETL